jgi:predicted alpha/beta hydrolase family esterase
VNSKAFHARRFSGSEREKVIMRIAIVPGNGCDNIAKSNWYSWLAERLVASNRFSEVACQTMPDPHAAKRKIWLPFMLSTLGCADPSTIVVGHSSGAVAALRLLEDNKLAGAVLVSSCHTDLGDAGEQAAGYYPPKGGNWKWPNIRDNAGGNIVVLHSDNDPFIPIAEAQFVADSLHVPLHVKPGRSHFFSPGEDIYEACMQAADAAEAAAAGSSSAQT